MSEIDHNHNTPCLVCIMGHDKLQKEIASLQSKLAHKALENAELNLRNRELVIKLEAKDEVIEKCKETISTLIKNTALGMGEKYENAINRANETLSTIDALMKKGD